MANLARPRPVESVGRPRLRTRRQADPQHPDRSEPSTIPFVWPRCCQREHDQIGGLDRPPPRVGPAGARSVPTTAPRLTTPAGARGPVVSISHGRIGRPRSGEDHDVTYPNTTYPNTPLHIDIPVKLDDVKQVFSVSSLSFEGDMPASLFHLGLIANDTADWGAKSDVVVVFHTNAGHVTLDDAAYNADRGVETGNRYKDLVTNLMSRGVQVELCGATAKEHHYGNGDLIPGIEVNRDAMARTTQLVQQGFVKTTED